MFKPDFLVIRMNVFGAINGCGIHLAKIGVKDNLKRTKMDACKKNGKPVNAFRIQPIALQNPDN